MIAGFITTSTTATSDLNNDVGFITSIVTGDFSVSGNISIGGTLTYEDVTNVDSVGLVTQDLVSKFQIVRKSMLVLVMIFRSIMMEITVILTTLVLVISD